MNVLFTSCIRFDDSEQPIIGASCSNGFIPNRDTNFCGRDKLRDLKNLIQRTTPLNEIKLPARNQLLYPFDEYSQLRQVRSSLDRPSTSFGGSHFFYCLL